MLCTPHLKILRLPWLHASCFCNKNGPIQQVIPLFLQFFLVLHKHEEKRTWTWSEAMTTKGQSYFCWLLPNSSNFNLWWTFSSEVMLCIRTREKSKLIMALKKYSAWPVSLKFGFTKDRFPIHLKVWVHINRNCNSPKLPTEPLYYQEMSLKLVRKPFFIGRWAFFRGMCISSFWRIWNLRNVHLNHSRWIGISVKSV